MADDTELLLKHVTEFLHFLGLTATVEVRRRGGAAVGQHGRGQLTTARCPPRPAAPCRCETHLFECAATRRLWRWRSTGGATACPAQRERRH